MQMRRMTCPTCPSPGAVTAADPRPPAVFIADSLSSNGKSSRTEAVRPKGLLFRILGPLPYGSKYPKTTCAYRALSIAKTFKSSYVRPEAPHCLTTLTICFRDELVTPWFGLEIQPN